MKKFLEKKEVFASVDDFEVDGVQKKTMKILPRNQLA